MKRILWMFCLAMVGMAGSASAYWEHVGAAGFSEGRADHVNLALDSNDTPYVVYQDWGNSGRGAVMRFDGTTWESVDMTGFSSGEAAETSLVFDSSDTLHAGFRDRDDSDKASVMKFNGTSWEYVGPQGFTVGGAQGLRLAIDGSDRLYVAFRDMSCSAEATVMSYNGASWETVGSVGFSEAVIQDPDLAIDGGGTPYVVFEDLAHDYDITVMRFDGVSWENVGPAGSIDSGGVGTDPRLSIAQDDTPYVTFMDGTCDGKATVMRYTGTQWESLGPACFSGALAAPSRLVFDSSGTPHVAYGDKACDASPGPGKLTVMQYDGTQWESLGATCFTAGGTGYPNLAFDSHDRAHVAFMDCSLAYKATVMTLMPDPTPTPAATPAPGVRIDVPAMVHVGEIFSVTGHLDNPGAPRDDVPTFFVLDAFGAMWFWPSWALFYPPDHTNVDFELLLVPTGTRTISVLDPFYWPDTGAQTVTGLYFHGAMLDEAGTGIWGVMASEEWGYGP